MTIIITLRMATSTGQKGPIIPFQSAVIQAIRSKDPQKYDVSQTVLGAMIYTAKLQLVQVFL